MARRLLGAACAAAALGPADGQLPGSRSGEQHPALRTYRCEASGCCNDEAMITLDANWRWVHNKGGVEDCYADSWASEFCPDGDTCAQGCEVEGEGVVEYWKKYGITTSNSSLSLRYVTKHEWGENVGSRVYVMQGDAYKIYKLKNRELSFDVDLSTLGCGINGALYFVGMAEDGELGQGENKAGAHYGLGYCDSECATILKWLGGTANVPERSMGVCCTQVDLWEANRHSPSFAMHTCGQAGPEKCDASECASRCDKDGCEYNTYRPGDEFFMGQGTQYRIDTTKPFTVTTRFITVDGTDEGALSKIERTYSQEGVTIQNEIPANLSGADDGSMSDSFCTRESFFRGVPDVFRSRGGMEELGKALDRGMVLAMSIWDDPASDTHWLDCAAGQGSQARETNPNATVHFSSIRVGAMGTTVQPLTGHLCHGVPKNVYEPDVSSLPAPSAARKSAKGASNTTSATTTTTTTITTTTTTKTTAVATTTTTTTAEPSTSEGHKKSQSASTSTTSTSISTTRKAVKGASNTTTATTATTTTTTTKSASNTTITTTTTTKTTKTTKLATVTTTTTTTTTAVSSKFEGHKKPHSPSTSTSTSTRRKAAKTTTVTTTTTTTTTAESSTSEGHKKPQSPSTSTSISTTRKAAKGASKMPAATTTSITTQGASNTTTSRTATTTTITTTRTATETTTTTATTTTEWCHPWCQPAWFSTSTTPAGPSISREKKGKGETAAPSRSADDAGSRPESSSTPTHQIGGLRLSELTLPPILTATTTPSGSVSGGRHHPPPTEKYVYTDGGRISVGWLLPGGAALGLVATGAAVVCTACSRGVRSMLSQREYASAGEVMSDTDEDESI